MDLKVTVYKSEEVKNEVWNKYKYSKYNGDKKNALAGIYIVVMDKKGVCISQATDDSGSTTFNLVDEESYIVYETVDKVVSTGDVKDESYFDSLVARQPIIDNSDTNPSVAVTSTTPRRYKIPDILKEGEEKLEFGHTLYKKISCNNMAYFIASSESLGSVFNEMDIKSGAIKEKFTNKDLELNGFAYNNAEGLFYTSDLDYGQFYRITEDYKVVQLDMVINSYDDKKLKMYKMSVGDIDSNGNYYGGDPRDTSNDFNVINLNPESLRYLYGDKFKYTSEDQGFIYRIADWKYNDNTKKLYSFADIKISKTNKLDKLAHTLVEFTVDLVNHKFIGKELDTNADVIPIPLFPFGVDNTIVGIFGYNNGLLFLLSATRQIYKTNINEQDEDGKIVIKKLNKIKGFGRINGDGANCPYGYKREDLGNAPNSGILRTASYKTRIEDFGPRHDICDDISLGKKNFPEDELIMAEFVEDNDAFDYPLSHLNNSAKEYIVNVRCYNNTKYNANLYGWLDWNCDGIFQIGESCTAIVEPADTFQIVRLKFARPSWWESNNDREKTFIRLRFTTENLLPEVTPDDINDTEKSKKEDDRSLSKLNAASDGEVEDWLIEVNDEKPYVTVDKTIVNEQGEEDPNKVFSSGEEINYQIVVTNFGPGDIKNIKISDDLEMLNDLEFIEASWVIDPIHEEDSPSGSMTTKQQVKDFILPKLCVNSVFRETIKCKVI